MCRLCEQHKETAEHTVSECSSTEYERRHDRIGQNLCWFLASSTVSHGGEESGDNGNNDNDGENRRSNNDSYWNDSNTKKKKKKCYYYCFSGS